MRPSVVDVHTHILPDPLLHRLLSGEVVCPGVRLAPEGDVVRAEVEMPQPSSGGARRFRLVRAHGDIEARLVEMRRLGVDVQVLSPLPYLFGYWLDPASGARWCRMLNDSLAEAAGQYPGCFRYLAGLPMQDPNLAVRELERSVTDGGAAGVAIGTHAAEFYLDSPRFVPFWEAVEGLSAWILLHPVDPVGQAAMRPYYLTNLVGNPVEIALAAARLIVSGVLLRYPRVRLCLAHGGGALPVLVGRMEHGSRVREEVPALASAVRDIYRRLYFDSVTHDPEALAYLVRTVGASHVCLGSDFPADMSDPDPVGTVRRAAGMTDEERTCVLSSAAFMASGPG